MVTPYTEPVATHDSYPDPWFDNQTASRSLLPTFFSFFDWQALTVGVPIPSCDALNEFGFVVTLGITNFFSIFSTLLFVNNRR